MTSLCSWGFPAAALALVFTGGTSRAEDSWLDVAGGTGPGTGKRVVLVSGDEEYRSEEVLIGRQVLGETWISHHGSRMPACTPTCGHSTSGSPAGTTAGEVIWWNTRAEQRFRPLS